MRFVQRDLLKGDQSAPLSLNRYLYCENDSVNFVDPSGKSLSELWEKAKTAVSNGAAAVKKVATAAYNAGKTVVKSAIQQVATVVKPVVNKVVNTVKEVATVAKTQGLVAAAKTLASNAASVPAYVNNVIKETVAERQSIQAKSAQQITGISRDLDKDLRSIGKDTYETLSPRNKKIIDDTAKTVEYMQQNGASQAAIDRVIRGACTQIAKNASGTIVSDIAQNAKDGISYNDKDATWFRLTKMALGSYVGSLVGFFTMDPVLGLQVAQNTTKYLNEEPFTISIGLNVDASAGLSGAASRYLTLDSMGNLVMQHSLNFGGGSPNVSTAGFLMITNAPSYKLLQAEPGTNDVPTLVVGGSYSGGLALGYDYNIITTEENIYSGHTISVGLGIGFPLPAEYHGLASYTWTDKILIEGN